MNILPNQIFNSLTTISKTKGGHQQHAKWICRCICGKMVLVRSYYLIHGKRKHCGCLTNEHRFYKKPYFHLYTTLKRTAKHREKECNLTFEEFLTFTSQLNCHYCGVSILWNQRSKDGVSGPYNLDRIDSSKGYSISNCVVCCGLCNYTKSDFFTYNEMLQIGEVIKNVRNQRTLKLVQLAGFEPA